MARHSVRLTLIWSLVSLVGVAAHAQVPLTPGPPTVVAQGEAAVKRAPDRAWLTVSVETRDTRAAEARRLNAELMTAVQDAVKRAGVAADAVHTSGFSLVPEMEWTGGRSVLRGYMVRNAIDVRVDDLTKLGDVIDAANVPRGTGLSILGPRFELKDEQAAQNEALRLAVQSALSRAESMATGARRTLGAILRIDQQPMIVPVPPPMPMRTMAARPEMQVETPITPGEIEVRAQVTVTVELR